MAAVTSYTADRIQELMSSLPALGGAQEALSVVMNELRTILESNDVSMIELREEILPQLQASLDANDVLVADLNNTTLPDLRTALDQAAAELENLQSVTIPNIALDLSNNIENVEARPNVYVQPEAPTNPDEDDRDLVVGDSWFDSDDNNFQRVWNGVEWSSFKVDIPDLSLTVHKFKTSTHMIY